MCKKRIRIVADSSVDIKELCGVEFSTSPLKIRTAEKEYIDDVTLDTGGMVTYLKGYKGKSSTACPNVNDWTEAFDGADEIYCITISGKLSGSYNSAVIAAAEYESKNPGVRVFVFDSLSTGPEMVLIAEHIRDLVVDGCDFDTVCKEIPQYAKGTGLIFMLRSLKNLANNGRVSPFVAGMAGVLGIRLVGKASDGGELEPLCKCRGEKNAAVTVFQQMKSMGYRGKKVRICHCFGEESAAAIKSLITNEFPDAEVDVYRAGGLCSFYAEPEGLIVGFEKE